MKGYDRYNNFNKKAYNRKGFSYYLMRYNPDKKLIPMLKGIKGKKILEVGVGYGYYEAYYFHNNNVEGYDINPYLGKDLDINIIEGKADDIGKLDGTYDIITSFFMTEYLSPLELEKFIVGSLDRLNSGGKLITTIVENKGIGWLYIILAGMKSIKKYNYSQGDIIRMVDGRKYKLTRLKGAFGFPFALLLEVTNE